MFQSVQELIGIAEIMPYIYTHISLSFETMHTLAGEHQHNKGSRAVLQLCVGVLLDRPGLESVYNCELNSSFSSSTVAGISTSLHQCSECFTGWTYTAKNLP